MQEYKIKMWRRGRDPTPRIPYIVRTGKYRTWVSLEDAKNIIDSFYENGIDDTLAISGKYYRINVYFVLDMLKNKGFITRDNGTHHLNGTKAEVLSFVGSIPIKE